MYFTVNDLITSIALFQLTIFLFFLLHKGKRNISNILLAVFFFTQLLAMVYTLMFSLKFYTIHNLIHLFFIGLPSSFLWAPLLYFYIKSLISENFKFKYTDLIHLVPFIVILIFISFNYHFKQTETKYLIIEKNLLNPQIHWITIIRNVLVLFYNTLSLWLLVNYEKSLKNYVSFSEKQNLKWIKYILFGYIAACLVNETYVFTESFTQISLERKDIIINGIFLIFYNMLFYKALLSPHIFIQLDSKPKYLSSNISNEEGKIILKHIEDYIKSTNAFLIPTLTLKELSNKTSIPERTISQVINQFKKQNFCDFINYYRIEKSKELLIKLDPEKTTMLAIALDSGFNSRNAFNEAFKKHTSISPSEFRKKNS